MQLELAPSAARVERKLGSASKWAATWTPRFLSVLRIVAGLLFLEYGLSKLFGFPHVTMFDGIHPFQPLWFAGIIELVGGALVTVGLFTRTAAFIMSGEMALGYLFVHAPKSFFPLQNGGDAAILFCFLFFYFFLAGPGPWSIELLRKTAVDRPVREPDTA